MFNDGHVEFRRDEQINPPYDPHLRESAGAEKFKILGPVAASWKPVKQSSGQVEFEHDGTQERNGAAGGPVCRAEANVGSS